MEDRKPEIAADIAAECGFPYPEGDRYDPFDCAQLRQVVAEVEGEEPRPGKDKRELMLRVADACGFGDETERYRETHNGPPPFSKTHLVQIRAHLTA